MKRLVYQPRVELFVKADDGVYDLSPFVVKGSVQRKLDQISTASLTIRNPDLMFTRKPVFHPMDPVVVTMTRLRDKPIQVFTGYLDASPYLQLFPGTVEFRASCTLKRLLHSYFDPGLPYMVEWLKGHGWMQSTEGGIVRRDQASTELSKDGQLVDSSFGKLLFAVLTDIGGWDDKAIYVEKLPEGLADLVEKLMFSRRRQEAEESFEDISELLNDIIGTAAFGLGALTGNLPAPADGKWVKVGATIDPTRGQAAYSDHGGMSFAELLVAGDNAGLKDEALYRVLGIKEESSYQYGMPMGTAIGIRMPGDKKTFKIWKNDVGSGQLGDSHYKIDLHQGIADALGWKPNEDVEVCKL